MGVQTVGDALLAPPGDMRFCSYTQNYGAYSYTQEMAINYNPNLCAELTVEPAILVNFTDTATGYHSGADFIIEDDLNYAPIPSQPKLFFGLPGHWAKQFQDDTIHGVVVGDGNRLKKVGIGPQIIYYFNLAAAIVLKWQHKMATGNDPSGDRFWIEPAVSL